MARRSGPCLRLSPTPDRVARAQALRPCVLGERSKFPLLRLAVFIPVFARLGMLGRRELAEARRTYLHHAPHRCVMPSG